MNRGILIYKDLKDPNQCYIRQSDGQLAGVGFQFIEKRLSEVATTVWDLAIAGDRYSIATNVVYENLEPYRMVTEEGTVYAL